MYACCDLLIMFQCTKLFNLNLKIYPDCKFIDNYYYQLVGKTCNNTIFHNFLFLCLSPLYEFVIKMHKSFLNLRLICFIPLFGIFLKKKIVICPPLPAYSQIQGFNVKSHPE